MSGWFLRLLAVWIIGNLIVVVMLVRRHPGPVQPSSSEGSTRAEADVRRAS